MLTIKNNISTFVKAVEANKSIICKKTGEWYCEGILMRIVRKILPWLEESRIANVARVLSAQFDELEKISVKFNYNGTLDLAYAQKYQPEQYVYAAQRLLKRFSTRCCTELAATELRKLQDRVISLVYRCEFHKPEQESAQLFGKLLKLAQDWKKEQTLAEQDISLTDKETAKLHEVCKYSLFANNILNEESLQISFLKWIIRYGLPVKVFIEFASTRDTIRENYFQGRLAYFEAQGIRIVGENENSRKQEQSFSKDLQLKFEWEDDTEKWMSILNPSQKISLKMGYTLTLQEIWEDFGKKPTTWGKVEMSNRGVSNWNVSNLSRWNGHSFISIDVKKENWWDQLPQGKRLTIAETQRRFGSIANGVNWLERSIATRKSDQPILPGAHAFEVVGIPKNGFYEFHTFGKSTTQEGLPQDDIDKGFAIGKTLPGSVISPDPSIYEARRQFGGSVQDITPQEGLEKMKGFKADIIDASNDNFPYQVFGANCAMAAKKWSIRGQKDLFEASFAHCQPPFPLDKLHEYVKKKPRWFQDKFFLFFFGLLGGWRGRYKSYGGDRKKYVSLLSLKPWTWHYDTARNKKFCIPSLDHRLFKLGNLHRVFNV